MIESIQKFDLNLIEWLQNNLRTNIFDYIMYAFTHLGDKYIFILFVVTLFWVVDKRFAFKVTITFIASAAVNVLLKNLFLRPRPYTEPTVDSVFTKTHGTSFPSGHSQAAGVLFYSINKEYGRKYKFMRYAAIFILILVPFSRMYLGQHYLTDVVTGALIGIGAGILGFKLVDLMKDREHIYPLFAIPVFLIALIFLYSRAYGDVKDIFVAVGGYIGFVSGYAIEKLYIKHNVNTTLKNKVFKMLIGLSIVALMYFGLKAIFPEENLIFDALRYGLIAITATAGIPYLFTKIFNNEHVNLYK